MTVRNSMAAIIPVRSGQLPVGADEALAECDGVGVLIGSGVEAASASLAGVATHLRLCEVGTFAPLRWARALSQVATEHVLVVPSGVDGRDLAPMVAHALARPLFRGAHRVAPEHAVLVLADGAAEQVVTLARPSVVLFTQGSRAVCAVEGRAPTLERVALALDGRVPVVDARGERAADPETVDLEHARRIIAGGAGLGGPEPFARLAKVGLCFGAALGATRVATDAGWVDERRQIGTTGAAVTPELYLAFGISGAVQHVMGLGAPHHIVAVNTDPSCPMMTMADLALVADAGAVVRELERQLAPPGSVDA